MKSIMKDIKISKLCMSMNVGKSGDILIKAAKTLKKVSMQSPSFGKARITVKSFGIRRGEFISTYCTLRGKKALVMLFKVLKEKAFTLRLSNFSELNNFGFGLTDHLSLGFRYDQNLGSFGISMCVSLMRPGFRISCKKRLRHKIGKNHRIYKYHATSWFMDNYHTFYQALDQRKKYF